MVAKENSDLLEAYKTYLKKQMIIKICNCQTLFFLVMLVLLLYNVPQYTIILKNNDSLQFIAEKVTMV
jgi:hypothetical protein